MNTPFRLDDHPRRSQPLASPPAGYFEHLPTQIMQRVQPPAAAEAGLGPWLTALSLPFRTALASVVVLVGFAVAYLLYQPSLLAPGSRAYSLDKELAAVPHAEMMQYVLASNDPLSVSDLAGLSVADRDIAQDFLQASPAEVQAALDAQPYESSYL